MSGSSYVVREGKSNDVHSTHQETRHMPGLLAVKDLDSICVSRGRVAALWQRLWLENGGSTCSTWKQVLPGVSKFPVSAAGTRLLALRHADCGSCSAADLSLEVLLEAFNALLVVVSRDTVQALHSL